MIKFFYALIFLLTFVSFITASQEPAGNSIRHVILPQDEIAEIAASTDDYVYFGPEVCSLAKDFPLFHSLMNQASMPCDNLTSLCERISRGKTTGLATTVEGALNEINEFLNNGSAAMPAEELDRLTQNFSAFYTAIKSGALDVFIEPYDEQSQTYRSCDSTKKFCLLRVCSLVVNSLTVRKNATFQGDLFVGGNEIIRGDLFVGGNETIQGDLTVSGTVNITPVFSGSIELIGNPQQACIIFVDNALTEKARICSSSIPGDKGVFISVDGGITQNFRVNNAGGSVIATPSSGIALTVNGGETIASGNLDVTAGNIILPQANAGGTQGLLELGGTGPTNVVMYEIGTRNLFAGNGAVNAGVTGTDNINIGTNANSTLTTANNTVAIGTSASAVGTDSIAVGDAANTTLAGAIVMGSRDSTGSGVAPTVTAINGIAIGSANGTRNGATVNGISGIAIGGSDNASTLRGALATGDRCIAIGSDATAGFVNSIALGSSSGATGGAGPLAGATNAIAIGSANDVLPGAISSGLAAVAIGGSDGVFAGANMTGVRSVGIGVNANSSQAQTIVLGSASGTAGGNAATAGAANAIAIGGANNVFAGANAAGLAAIAIGGSAGTFAGASAIGNRSIAVGSNATSSLDGSIAIGSATTAGGIAPTASNTAAIAIGSASGALAGATASGFASIAIGGSSGSPTTGAGAFGDRSIALGVSATSTGALGIAIGSASGSVGSAGPNAFTTNGIAIGSGSGAASGASATGVSAVAIGPSNGVNNGAAASGARSVAIGASASTAQNDAIVLGNSDPVGASPVRVGIGISAPTAKLHVVGVNGTPVVRFDQVNNAIGNAPQWLNPSTGVGLGIPIYYDNLNRFFGNTSSRRYKTNIKSITDDESSTLYKLNPVLYDAKEGHGEGTNIAGFIAEEMFEVAPQLVVLNKDGQPETVAYNSILSLAVKEIQKQQKQLDTQSIVIEDQSKTITNLLSEVDGLRQKIGKERARVPEKINNH